MLSIKDFASAIAEQVNGEVKEVEKANRVIKTAVIIPTDNEHVQATYYVDSMYDDGFTVDEAVEQLKRFIANEQEHRPAFNIDFFTDFEQVKPRLRARLYNKITKSDVSRSASKYGLDDLIITASVEIFSKDGQSGTVRVKQEHLKAWNVTADEVLDIAEQNSKEHATLSDMVDIMSEMGYPADDSMRGQMIVVTNDTKSYGAYSIIAKLDELRAMFPNGFAILPSSVHEVIVTPVTDDCLDDMVQNVNDEQVDPEEQLSNHAYRIAA